jgi:hypothetical protein
MFYVARWYDPYLNRFIQPDSIVPDPKNPVAWDRYAYSANNPVKYNDPSGHCWGAFSWVRSLPSYGTTCNNLDMALVIVTSPDTTVGQKVAAGAYIAAEGTAHAVAATVAPCVAAAETALGIGTAACTDGDCTNEATAGAQIVQGANTGVQQVINVFQNISKFDARAALRAGIESLTNGQIQKALDILGKGRADNLTLNVLENGNAQFVVERAGYDGFQRLIYTIDSSGKVVGLIQQAFNAAGELVHHHDKLNNIIFK